jgi:hypothetical protein
MALLEQNLYELREDDNDLGLVVGGCIVREVFEHEAVNAGHRTERLEQIVGLALEQAVELVTDTDN